jgi:hypothetical protein
VLARGKALLRPPTPFIRKQDITDDVNGFSFTAVICFMTQSLLDPSKKKTFPINSVSIPSAFPLTSALVLSPYLYTLMEPRNRFRGIDSASLCSLADRYDKRGCRTARPGENRFQGSLKGLQIQALDPLKSFSNVLLPPGWEGGGGA